MSGFTILANATPDFVKLYKGNIIPLRACLPGLTWILHDYFLTLEDEVKYIWPQRPSFGKFMFFWIRYYSIALLMFDVTQIHLFARPGITSKKVCLAMDSIIRIVGGISLWSIEIVMQLRIYAIWKCSKRVALINAFLFTLSIAGFMFVLVYNAMHRAAVIAHALQLPLPGCPSIHVGIEWMQWVPAAIFEFILFLWAAFKSLETIVNDARRGNPFSLYSTLIRDNILYFFGITCILIFNNLMVANKTKIPWFGYSLFHAAMGIMTSRLLLSLRKAYVDSLTPESNDSELETFRVDVSIDANQILVRPDERKALSKGVYATGVKRIYFKTTMTDSFGVSDEHTILSSSTSSGGVKYP